MLDEPSKKKENMNTLIKGIALSLLLSMWFLPLSTNAQSISVAEIDRLRQDALQAFNAERFGAGYSAMINFAVVPDISTARYNIDSDEGDDPRLNVTRIPLRHVFKSDLRDWSPFIEVGLAYQTIKADFDILEGETISADWKASGGSLSTGVEFPITENFSLIPVLDIGLVRLENEANYQGELVTSVVKPVYEGLLFDWDADAWLIGASLGFDYNHDFRKADVTVHGSITHNYIDTYDSSSDLIDFDSHDTTLAIKLDSVHPTNLSVGAFPLALVTHVGGTTFLGNNRDALGFDYFFEFGLAIEMDISQKQWHLNKFRLGANAIYGEDVTGWGLLLGYRF